MRVEATVFNLMQIGELAKASLSDAAKAAPGIPWKQIYGLRNRVVHGDDGCGHVYRMGYRVGG